MTESFESNVPSGVSRREVLAAAGAIGIGAMAVGDSFAANAADVEFSPNRCSFETGIERVRTALSKANATAKKGIVTSRDSGMEPLLESLRVTNVPKGFTKFQLPVFFEGGPGAQFYLSYGAPDTEVPEHSHDEGDGIRFILSGSIIYNGKELTSGDWMFIPKGEIYAMRIGRGGAGMCYCYQCCCA